VRYSMPVSERLLELLGTLEPWRTRTLMLDQTCLPDGPLRCLSLPAAQIASW
jgi:hypothetical protein